VQTQGADVIDPIEIPNLVRLLEDSGTNRTNVYETEQVIDEYLAQHQRSHSHHDCRVAAADRGAASGDGLLSGICRPNRLSHSNAKHRKRCARRC
jgi:hypothetical protein